MLREGSPLPTCHESGFTFYVSHVMCHMSGDMCHMSCVTCHMSHVNFFLDNVVKLVSGGYVINGAYPV